LDILFVMSHADDHSPDAAGRKTTVNLDRYSAHTLDVVRAVTRVAEEVFGSPAVRELEGSVSMSADAKVIAKVLPQEPGEGEYVLLGVSSEFCPQQWPDMPAAFDGPFLVRESPFHFLTLQRDSEAAAETARPVFRELKSRLASD